MNVLIASTCSFVRSVEESLEECGIKVDGFVEFTNQGRCTTEADRLKKPILWYEDAIKYSNSHLLVHGIGTIAREGIVSKATTMGFKFATFVHPKAHVCKSVKLGAGVYIDAGCFVGTDSVIGDHVMLLKACFLGHDIKIGAFTTVTQGAILAGFSSVGRGTFVAIGANILDKKSVGDYCIVGAGAVVTKKFGNNLKLVGVPARIMGGKTRGR